MKEVLTALHEIVKDLPKLRDKPFVLKTRDTNVPCGVNSSEYSIQYSFSVSESDHPSHHKKQINFTFSRSTISCLAASVQTLCSLSVVYDVAWFFNSISKVHNQISMNNIPESHAYFMSTGGDVVAILPEQITEEWLFQLLTLHDIPFYEDMAEYDAIHKTIRALPFKMSINFNYQEQYWSTFLEQIKGYLDET